MMTKEEFIRNYRAQQKHGNGWAILWLCLFFAVLIGNAIFVGENRVQSKGFVLLGFVGLFIFLICQVPLLRWWQRYETRKFNLCCPKCDRSLIGTYAQIVIASAHCPHCGDLLFMDATTHRRNED